MAEAHEKADVDENRRLIRAAADTARARMSANVVACLAADDDEVPAAIEGSVIKKVHLIRHGEGFHNVAQREWRAQADWDGVSEPYTLVTDPEMRFLDPELTPVGVEQAKALCARTATLSPGLLVVSPMKRALQTGLIAFEQHVAGGRLGPAVATDLLHEQGGKHTCDRRSSKEALSSEFPNVDFALLAADEDPYWGDGSSREPLDQLACRAADFVEWLRCRPEQHVAVAAHSAILLSVMNAGFLVDSDEASSWLATGEMRTFMVTFTEPKS